MQISVASGRFVFTSADVTWISIGERVLVTFMRGPGMLLKVFILVMDS